MGTDSYSNVFASLARTLGDEVPDVALCNFLGQEPEDPALAPLYGLDTGASVGIFLGFPTDVPDFLFSHRIRIGMFVCETDQILPEWVRVCNRFQLIVVPSWHCRTAFLRSGVTRPVMVVPHGVHPQHRPLDGRRPAGKFVFYNTFRGRLVHDRKGYSELIRCFQAAFQGRDDVVLRLRVGDPRWLPVCPGWPDYGGLVEFDPPGALPLADAAAVYSEVHCTVHPSKGEGFGLVPLESIACGTPVIAPAIGGMADYLNEDNSIELRPGRIIRAPRFAYICGRYHAVDEEDLVEKLRYAVDHWEDERGKLESAGAEVRRRYAWPGVLRPLVELVQGALECGADGFEHRAGAYVEPGEHERYYEEAGRRAGGVPGRVRARETGARLPFSSIVYSGWDYPPDGIGRHLRLLDGLVFDGPELRYKSFDERPASYSPEPYDGLESYVHEQRPDLFQKCLYLDVVGLPGGRKEIQDQVEQVARMRRRFDAASVIYLMWETDRLWEPMLKLLEAHELTIITSSLLESYLTERGIRHVRLPHPYHFAVCEPSAGKAALDRPIIIGISAGLWPRKNLALAAETFEKVLGDDPAFRLRIHTRTKPVDPATENEYQRLMAACRCPNIELEARSLSREEYLGWLDSLDVYCFVSSGEGWSVTPREALHRGKPVILLDAHVHREFSHLPGVIPVPPGPPQPARPGFRWIDGDIGQEASVDLGALERILADLRPHWEQARTALATGFAEVLAHHDTDMIRERWVRALASQFGNGSART
ncbi:MAG: glycosyltransferase [Arenicellales bacterium]